MHQPYSLALSESENFKMIVLFSGIVGVMLQRVVALCVCLLSAYQRPAEEHRAPAMVRCCPGDELLHVVQLAAYLYDPLQLVFQPLLEVLGDLLQRNTETCARLWVITGMVGPRANQWLIFLLPDVVPEMLA